MNQIDLIEELRLTGQQYDAAVVVQLPTGEFALIRSVDALNGEIVIATTLDARQVQAEADEPTGIEPGWAARQAAQANPHIARLV